MKTLVVAIALSCSGFAAQAALTHNALTTNALTTNALTANAITANALISNALVATPAKPESLKSNPLTALSKAALTIE